MQTDADQEGLLSDADYQLRIFLSVDVSGSTAFKFSNDLASSEGIGSKGTRAGWFAVIRKFYESFHATFQSCARSMRSTPRIIPELWKVLGDELIYSAVVTDKHDAAIIVQSFIDAIHRTRPVVRGFSTSLDLKGCAWLADFPARNAEIDLDGLHDRYSEQESSEQLANESARGVKDYIGPSMDTGFRIAKAASRQRMPLTVELAMVLAAAENETRNYPFCFGYDGREDLKGVLAGEAYPIIWLDIEENVKRRASNRREAAMLQTQPEVSSEVVFEFCESFIDASDWLEPPYLKSEGQKKHFCEPPESYKDYAARHQKFAKDEAKLYGDEGDNPPQADTDQTMSPEAFAAQLKTPPLAHINADDTAPSP